MYLISIFTGNLYHWQSFDIGDQELIPWGKFFNLDSLRKYVPVLEMYEFFQGMLLNTLHTLLD